MFERYTKASEELRTSVEWQVSSRLKELDLTFRLLAKNYEELKTWTREQVVEDDVESGIRILSMWDQKNRGELEANLEEANRRLHNFLAAANTLVDHTRNHVRDLYKDSSFKQEQDKAVDKLIKTKPICRLVHCLRNYNLHYRIPFITGSLHIDFDPPGEAKSMTTRTSLDVVTLRKWDGWDRHAKRYLAALGDQLTIEKLADDYMLAIAQFYDWQRTRELEIQRLTLLRLQQKIDRLISMERTLFGVETGSA